MNNSTAASEIVKKKQYIKNCIRKHVINKHTKKRSNLVGANQYYCVCNAQEGS